MRRSSSRPRSLLRSAGWRLAAHREDARQAHSKANTQGYWSRAERHEGLAPPARSCAETVQEAPGPAPARPAPTCSGALLRAGALLAGALLATATVGQEAEPAKRFRFGLEVKGHFRSSDDTVLTAPFENPSAPGESIRLTTVDPGDHFELSTVTFTLDGAWREDGIHARLKVDAIDEYDKNPTSTDNDVDIDEAWLRFGREREPGDLAMAGGAFLKLGKMPAFERQDDRHLESYGLVSTAFNRMEDIGLEFGWRAGKHLWGRVSLSEGNPLFFRDPTALAGDNGTPPILDGEEPELGSGLAIIYDAETEDISFDEPEVGVGLGLRFGDEVGHRAVDVLVWARRRQLQETVDLVGTFYGGDLDFLRGPLNGPPFDLVDDGAFSFPITDDDKQEVGFNLWYYQGGFSLFLQAVDADTAGLERQAWEAEAAWRFDLPLVASIGGKQVFSSIQPAIRFSKLEPDFAIPSMTPSPSLAWEWEKLDVGLRIDLWNGFDLTAEFALNRFVVRGRDVENNETLLTLRYEL